MIFIGCPREKELSELVRRGQWPQACPPDLQAHVRACPACTERLLVTAAFQSARAAASAQAPLAAPGPLWWRAQLRRRNAALERIGKPILGAQIFALAIALVLTAGFLASQAKQDHGWLSWLAALPHSLDLAALWPATLPGFASSLWLVVPILATLALLSGVVVYIASEKQ